MGDEACTEFGDKKGNSQNSVMNSSQAGIAHIYVLLWRLYEAKNCVQMGGGGYSLAVTSAKQYLTGSFSLLNINLGHL